MALFSRNKKAEAPSEAVPTTPSEAPSTAAQPTDRDLASVIIRPRITEKAVMGTEKGVYTFLVRKDATKYQVRDAVKQLFSVTPMKVNIVNKAPARRLAGLRGRKVKEAGYKKAYVYLKPGETINLV